MAVVERLGAALGLSDERAARSRWAELRGEIATLSDQIASAEAQLDVDTSVEIAALLERWPVLDDPLHPDFDVTLRENRGAIEQLLSSSPEARARAVINLRLRVLNELLNRAWVTEARVFRVVRAYETMQRAAALMKSGGAAARHYQALLACERAAL